MRVERTRNLARRLYLLFSLYNSFDSLCSLCTGRKRDSEKYPIYPRILWHRLGLSACSRLFPSASSSGSTSFTFTGGGKVAPNHCSSSDFSGSELHFVATMFQFL